MDNFLSKIENEFYSTIQPSYLDWAKYAFSSGKRVRPRLIFELSSAFSVDPLSLAPAASAIEGIHCGSLIHDDIVDHDSLRRNEPSFSSKFGIPSAILFGDYLLANSVKSILHQYGDVNLSRKTIETVQSMIESQMMESRNEVTTFDSYLQYIYGKTASLFELCGHALADIASISDSRLIPFCTNYGMAFQIADDLSEEHPELELNIQRFLSRPKAELILNEYIQKLKKDSIIPIEKLLIRVEKPESIVKPK